MSDVDAGASDRVVELTRFMDYGEAHLARARLEEAGLDCIVADQNISLIQPMYRNAVGGIKLLVRQSDRAAAREVLLSAAEEQGLIPADDEQGADLESDSRSCPECESHFVLQVGIPTLLAVLGVLMLGIPFMFLRPKWRCSSCGHEWRS
jgi:Putative prokaryotic signal transducing protein